MAYEYSDLVAQTKNWAKQVIDTHWASEVQLNSLINYDARTPNALFEDSSSRPLIVAFLGGTGVGKSTLLNRLAGKEIARTGVIRPTSKEVTLFHHQSVKMAALPKRLPIEKIQIAEHSEESNRQIIWIDMPDFDSTEKENQHLVLEWLPHIDILIYVVSPERYRDSKAWKILQAEGGKHAWIFVLNQADRGQAEQYQDFAKQLAKAGFNDPMIFQTSCAPDKSADQLDEFAELQASLQSLASKNTVQQLEHRGIQVRKEELSNTLQSSLAILGSESATAELSTFWQTQWQELEALLIDSSGLAIKELASHYALQSSELNKPDKQPYLHDRLWDEWAKTRFNDVLDSVVLQADHLGLPVAPIKQQLESARESSEKLVEDKTLLSVRKALINPGNIIQRSIIKIAKFAEILLPLAAMSWVGYQVFTEFYESSLEEVPHYLGTDFAINSGMLIAIAWLLPFFIRKQLKPSIEKAASKGLNHGFASALQTLELSVLEEIQANGQVQDIYRKQAQLLIAQCAEQEEAIPMAEDSSLERMLL